MDDIENYKTKVEFESKQDNLWASYTDYLKVMRPDDYKRYVELQNKDC